MPLGFYVLLALFLLGPWAVNRHLLYLDKKAHR